ncbi:MAG: helix-turn-helix domain-containing protein [Microbacteriaceae bacterium]
MANDRELAETLTDIARDISTLRVPELLLSSIARRARLLLKTDIAYLSLNDAENTETYIRSTDGVRTAAYAAIRMPLGTGVLGLAAGGIITETPDYLPDEGKTHLPDIDQVVHKEGVRAILGAPLRVSGKVVGALMVANRRPGAFSADQRDDIEHLASLAAAAVELVAAKEAQAASLRTAAAATERHDALDRIDAIRADLDQRLSAELAEHRGPEDVLAVAADVAGASIRVVANAGEELASSPTPTAVADRVVADVVRVPLTGDAGPGTVIVEYRTATVTNIPAAVTIAQYVSIALVYDRTLDDIRHFHENELVNVLLTPAAVHQQSLSPSVLQRALGPDGRTSVAVLTNPDDEEAARRRLLARVRGIAKRGNTLVASHLGRIVVISRDPEDLLTEPLVHRLTDLPYFGGISSAAGLATVPNAYSEAVAIAAAMRALGRSSLIADSAGAGIAGLLLRTGNEDLARRYLKTHLGPLLSRGRPEALLTTALAYLDENGSVDNTAARLHLHPNTIRQRLERIDTALSRSWRNGSTRLDTHVALRLWQIAGEGRVIPTRR